ncbi:DNA methyltransferase [Vibrio aestuarianus]|uniref:DNA methyltransferase n=1 Tax=Vibrio aestuarianus TaxID=28171 RepID=A0ABN8TSJ8_9VIBR|nr:DNA methyltransferase [Vibrio aestuarianus]MDE1213787.1 class I SAM-dependent methyltransferase [Vibrio aestuarianus]MDE1217244.1 class I SAM-dependent methyltransferase [Vibrio aestuarianus]MDE1256985.1 class I SAM-dependent methyltransferase [Vibrio aestuarianus]MDE1260785.1 class I SAM-dependent methyltransferase [Vibrio aestuarianus]MDE1267581.1 class I SAM-dependent methyltransferase [Vibrio aestuarianus]
MSSTNGKVEPSELYPTPPEVVDALLAKLTLRETDTFLEPCYGTGAIFDKVDLPLSQKSYAEIEMGVDYLTTNFGKQDVIITNPPFSLTEEFIRKSLNELAPNGTMAYLQRVNFLGSIKRVPFWAEVGFPNKTPIIVPRPRFVKGRSDSCEYSWFIWDYGNRFNIPQALSHIISGEV